ncbi:MULTISPECIES: TonB-dependent receptor [unclassified Sphingomonas]|uniref:TonB-dependent receptor n=1 Tax=unclassified Sphingomonas TaxID=196159 RepID=UPI00226A9E5B|nr:MULTISPECIES: TonB-dependent receptor [unclassified Sphingomonas]
MKAHRLLAVALGGTAFVGIAPSVWAQNVPAGQATAPADTGASTPDTQPANTGDIIVTANKREERLKDVPITVTVISGDQIAKQNINEVTDLTRSAPALNSAGPFGALSIRGVGSLSFARSAEGSVGLVVDGVALANTSTNPPQLFDLSRVEILEGSQGTLFGRNSSAGVVNITTNAPDPTHYEVIGHADIASRNNYIGRGVVNIPVADNAALRVSGAFSQSPENQYNRYDDSSFRVIGRSGRARFLWDPIPDLTINLIGDYSKFSRRGGVPWSVYYSTPGSLLSQRLAACGIVVGPQNQQGCTNGGTDTESESWGFSGQVDARIGDFTLTSISAYRKFSSQNPGSDVDSVPVNRLDINASPSDIENFSQELRLTSPTGGLVDYVLGLYYFDSKLESTNIQRGQILADLGVPFFIGQVQNTRSYTTSYAAFGNATVHVTDWLRLIGGARYGHEDVAATTDAMLAANAVAPILSIAPIRGRVTDTYFSFKAGAQIDLNRDVMLYGTYTRGYKGPSVNDQTGSGAIPLIVQPEIPHSAEIGVKANLFDGHLTATLAGFHNRVVNFQAQFFLPSASAFVFGNAPRLTTNGVSFDLTGRPVRGLTVNGGLLYNDAKYGSGYYVACAQGQTTAPSCITVGGGRVDDAGGNQLAGAPRWKVTGYGEYETHLGGSLNGFVNADMVYTSRIYWDAAYDPIDTNAPAAIFGARVGVRTANGRYGVSAFARNLFDTYRSTVRFATPTAQQQRDPVSFSQISGPESRRVIGGTLDVKF